MTIAPTLFGPSSLGDYVREGQMLIEQALYDYKPVATIALISGGNDSTVMLHLASSYIDAACMANTGIGIEQTRQFTRDLCADWGVRLIEKHPPAKTYREMVLTHGFPGPKQHDKAYSWLKERALDEMRRDFLEGHGRKARILLLTGVRSSESRRRMGFAREVRRDGRAVWIAPILHFTAEVMAAYRTAHTVPRNEVADLLHMSGECLCGAYAIPGEREELGLWFPEVLAEIEALEAEAANAGVKRCRWGWGASDRRSRKATPLCQCALRLESQNTDNPSLGGK